MPGYVYRDELLERAAPLLELLNLTPEAVYGLRITPGGVEVDMPGGFAYYTISDRDTEPVTEPVEPVEVDQ